MRKEYDIIIIGAGSAGLGVSLFMAKVGLKTLLIDKTDERIGGDCLNDGCVPSKALIHVSRIIHHAHAIKDFGFDVSGTIDIQKVTQYIKAKQNIIREHENATFLRKEGMDVVLGVASFHDHRSITVNNQIYGAKKIVIATGSRPTPLQTKGVEKVKLYNNESVFELNELPQKLLVVGGGPIGVEMGQAMNRLGAEVTIIHKEKNILPHDDVEVTDILLKRLKGEGIRFMLDAQVDEFKSATEAVIKTATGEITHLQFEAVFAATGRSFDLASLNLEKAGIKVEEGKIVRDKYLQTTNKLVFVCGDIAGSLQFSHAAEQHARLLINNLFSPFKKKLDNSHLSWVTFSDPEVATFGLQEGRLKEKKRSFERLVLNFNDDDRAVIDNHRYGKLILFLSKKHFLGKQKILGGSMVAPGAGEIIQELILANSQGLSINTIFNKIYPYPVAARVNQMIIVNHKEKQLTASIKKLLAFVYRWFN